MPLLYDYEIRLSLGKQWNLTQYIQIVLDVWLSHCWHIRHLWSLASEWNIFCHPQGFIFSSHFSAVAFSIRLRGEVHIESLVNMCCVLHPPYSYPNLNSTLYFLWIKSMHLCWYWSPLAPGDSALTSQSTASLCTVIGSSIEYDRVWANQSRPRTSA